MGDYNNWLRSQDANIEGERCAVLDTEMWDCTDTCEYPDGNWIAKNCTQKHAYMCKVKTGLLIQIIACLFRLYIVYICF